MPKVDLCIKVVALIKITNVCRRCLSTYRSQSQLENHMARCFEQELCNISFMDPVRRNTYNDCYMKMDPPIWIDGYFECVNKPKDDPHQKTLFINVPVGVNYDIVKNP